MSDYLAEVIGKTSRDLEEINRSMSHPDSSATNIIFPVDTIEMDEVDIVIKRREISGDTLWYGFNWNGDFWDDAYGSGNFILGHATYAILGTSKLGSFPGSWVEVVRRLWSWDTQTLLEQGTKDANIDLTNGDIRLAD